MNTLLLLLIIFGLGAIIISIHVFAEGARTYDRDSGAEDSSNIDFHKRSLQNRRSNNSVTFPLAINGAVIPEDRRTVTDRRQLAA